MKNILYIHGMGGGADSRIPRLLSEWFSTHREQCCVLGDEVSVVCRTYDFDPETAWEQICSWVEELDPALVIGESLGSCNALRVRRNSSKQALPHILVSPALNAPLFLGYLSILTLVPGMTALMDRIYRPRPGNRQPLHFVHSTMKKYRGLRNRALRERDELVDAGICAFFGTRDHYRRRGIVSVRGWKKLFGEGSFVMYEGSHYMEEESVYSLLIPKILLYLQAQCTD